MTGHASRSLSAPIAGLAVAAIVLAPLPLAGAASLGYMAGYDGLWIGLGLALGIVLAGTLVAAPIGRGGAATPTAFVAQRFGTTTAAAAAAVIVLALVLAMAGQLASLSPVVAMVAGAAPATAPVSLGDAAVAVGVLAICFVAIGLGGARGALILAAFSAAVAVVAVVIAAIAQTTAGGATLPVAYGNLVQDSSRLELALLGQRLADATTLKAHATPHVTLDAVSFFGALLGAAAGTAALSVAVAPRLARPGDDQSRLGGLVWCLLLLLPVLVLMPAMAAAIKVALYRGLIAPSPVGATPDWLLGLSRDGLATICGRHPVDASSAVAACKAVGGHRGMLRLQDIGMDGNVLWLVGGRIAGLPPALAMLPAGAAISATIAAVAAILSVLVGGLRGPTAADAAARPSRHTGSRIVLTAACAVALALALLAPGDAADLSGWVLPLIASTLLPLLLIGLWWRRATPAGALAGLVAGAAVTLYYLVGTRYFPVGFYDLWQTLSPASLGAERKLVALRDAWAAADGATRATAWQAVVEHARGMASWWSIKPQAAALFGLPVSVVTILLVSLVTRRPGGSSGRRR